jgi:serine/threonine protein kinase
VRGNPQRTGVGAARPHPTWLSAILAERVLPAKPGESIGNYRILGKLGSGGMGVVYAAEHVLLGRRAAIKFLRPEVSSEPLIVERFFTEARAASSVRHQGIVEVYDFGYHDGLAYLVMEHLEGETLRSALKAEGRIPPERAVTIALHIASALDAAHAAGVVHRDLKPDNVFLAKTSAPDLSRKTQQLLIGRVCILDFGVAKLLPNHDGESNPSITTSDVVVGTPTFMSPEQCRGGGNVDGRSDLYALGCILYTMLCARPPFVGKGSGDVLAQHIYQAPDPPSWYAADVTPDLEGIILRLLEKDPDRRFQTAHDVARALRAVPLSHDQTGGTTVSGPPPAMQADQSSPSMPIIHMQASSPQSGSSPSMPHLARDGSSPSMLQHGSSPQMMHGSSPSMAHFGPHASFSGSGYAMPPQPRSRAALLWAGGVMILLLIAGAVVLSVTQSTRAEEPIAAEPAAPEAAKATAADADAPSETMVSLTIVSEPSGAEVYREGQSQRLGRTPYLIKQPAEPGYASFELRLEGYEPELLSVRTDATAETRAVLRPTRPAAKVSGKKGNAVPDIKSTRRTSDPEEPEEKAPLLVPDLD